MRYLFILLALSACGKLPEATTPTQPETTAQETSKTCTSTKKETSNKTYLTHCINGSFDFQITENPDGRRDVSCRVNNTFWNVVNYPTKINTAECIVHGYTFRLDNNGWLVDSNSFDAATCETHEV